jgi:hypothetical protein
MLKSRKQSYSLVGDEASDEAREEGSARRAILVQEAPARRGRARRPPLRLSGFNRRLACILYRLGLACISLQRAAFRRPPLTSSFVAPKLRHSCLTSFLYIPTEDFGFGDIR